MTKPVTIAQTGDEFDVEGWTCTDVAAIVRKFPRAETFEFLVDAKAAPQVMVDVACAGLYVGTDQPAALARSRQNASAGPEQIVVLRGIRPARVVEVVK